MNMVQLQKGEENSHKRQMEERYLDKKAEKKGEGGEKRNR